MEPLDVRAPAIGLLKANHGCLITSTTFVRTVRFLQRRGSGIICLNRAVNLPVQGKNNPQSVLWLR